MGSRDKYYLEHTSISIRNKWDFLILKVAYYRIFNILILTICLKWIQWRCFYLLTRVVWQKLQSKEPQGSQEKLKKKEKTDISRWINPFPLRKKSSLQNKKKKGRKPNNTRENKIKSNGGKEKKASNLFLPKFPTFFIKHFVEF